MGTNQTTFKVGYNGTPAERMERFTKRAGPDECWEWQGSRSTAGYGHIKVDDRLTPAHRIAFTMAKGPIPPGKIIMHSCDNRRCCNPAHLSIGTKKENAADMLQKGRANKATGLRHHAAKLTPADIDQARALKARGVSLSAIGRQFGVDRTTVRNAITGRTWRSI